MTESFLYEADKYGSKSVGKEDGDTWDTAKGRAGKYKGKVRYFDGDNADDAADDYAKSGKVGDETGGADKKDDKPDTKKQTTISTTGGFGDDDADATGGDKPKDKPEKTKHEDFTGALAGDEEAGQIANDLAQDELSSEYTHDDMEKRLTDMGHGDLAKAIRKADSDEEKAALISKATESPDDDMSGDEERIENEIEKLNDKIQSMMGDMDPDTDEIMKLVKKKDDLEDKLYGESIKTINGKKYKAIKESVNKRVTVKEVKSWLKGLEEFRYRKIPNVDARRITSFVNNGLSETDLPQSLQKKWGNAKYSREKHLADKFVKERISKKLARNESNHPIKEQYNRLFKNKVVL